MPMFWPAEELHALEGTPLWKKSMGQCQLPGFHVEPPVQVLILWNVNVVASVHVSLYDVTE